MLFLFEHYCQVAGAFVYGSDQPLLAEFHQPLLLIAVLEGAYQVNQEESRIAERGSFVLSGLPGVLTPIGPSRVGGIFLAGTVPEEVAAKLGGVRIFPQRVAGSLESAIRLVEGAHTMPPSEASALAYTLLCRLTADQNPPLPPLVAAAVAEIREHYAEVYGIEELAAGLEISKGHLIRAFSAAMGMSPGRYLTAVRVENAKRLLLHDNLTLDMVAGLCGFSGANYLCKVFKTETGETPSAWKRHSRPPTPPAKAGDLELGAFL